jgi:excisionase family DNA binding protein
MTAGINDQLMRVLDRYSQAMGQGSYEVAAAAKQAFADAYFREALEQLLGCDLDSPSASRFYRSLASLSAGDPGGRAAVLTRLTQGKSREAEVVGRLWTLAATSGRDLTHPVTVEFVAAVLAAVLIERSSLGTRATRRLRNQTAHHDVAGAIRAWRSAKEAGTGDGADVSPSAGPADDDVSAISQVLTEIEFQETKRAGETTRSASPDTTGHGSDPDHLGNPRGPAASHMKAWNRGIATEDAACVEVAFAESVVLIRSSADPEGPVLRFTLNEWREFVNGVKSGKFGTSRPGRHDDQLELIERSSLGTEGARQQRERVTQGEDSLIRQLAEERSPAPERLLTPAEVAALFRVDPKTITQWAASGRLTSIRTLGGHRRYRESEVRQLLQARGEAAAAWPRLHTEETVPAALGEPEDLEPATAAALFIMLVPDNNESAAEFAEGESLPPAMDDRPGS